MKSIRNRLTSTLVAAGALLIVALSLAIYAGARALLREQFDDGLRARLQAMVSLLHWQADAVELDYKGEFMPEFEHRGGGFFFQVWTEGQQPPLERSHSLVGADLPRFGGTLDAPEFRDWTLPDRRPVRAAGLSVRRGRKERATIPELMRAPAGPGADVVVAGDTSALHARLQILAMEIAAGATIGLAALTLLIRHTLRRELGPLNALSQRTAQLDATSLGERYPVANLPSELEPITRRLNELLARLERAFAQEKRFSANVAHELKTPIAELLSLAEVGSRLNGRDPQIASFFKDAGDIARRMDTTASSLLLLARCEDGSQPIERSTFNLRESVEPLCQAAGEEAARRHLSFEYHTPDLGFETDRNLFERLCHLLLDNAVEYTPPGGSVNVVVRERELTMSNGPVSLVPGDMAHLFERFWRKDAARAGMRHSGLGLALAMELARVLGMRLVPELDPDRTFRMRLILSSAQPVNEPPRSETSSTHG